jgi:hypothetical protein
VSKPALPYTTLRCYACDGEACGVRDRRPEGGIVEAACKRHADPTIRTYAACYMCLGARPTVVIDGQQLVHKKCHAEDCAA